MDMQAYCDEIRFKLTGGVLQLELNDSELQKIVNSAFREIQRYIDTTKLATIPYKPCMDLSDCGVSSVSRVFRTQGYLGNQSDTTSSLMADPMYASQWQLMAGSGDLAYLNNWVYDYSAWNTMLQIRNTMSTDLSFRFDKHTNYLYVNAAWNRPDYITIEYIPRYNSVDEIVSDFWIDKLMRLALALTKVTVGMIRSKFTQSNALWSIDGEKLRDEGTAELTEIRESLVANNQLVYPVD